MGEGIVSLLQATGRQRRDLGPSPTAQGGKTVGGTYRVMISVDTSDESPMMEGRGAHDVNLGVNDRTSGCFHESVPLSVARAVRRRTLMPRRDRWWWW